MIKIIPALLLLTGAPAFAAPPNQGNPTFGSLALQTPLGTSSGGTGSNTAAAALLNLGGISTSKVNAASGVAGTDASNNISAQTVLPTGSGSASSLATLLAPAGISQTNGSVAAPGGYLGPLGNYQSSGIPNITLPPSGYLIFNQTPSSGGVYTGLNIRQNSANVTSTSNNQTALQVSSTEGASQPGGDWNVDFENFCYTTISGGSCLGENVSATMEPGSAANAWGLIVGAWDKTDLSSGTNNHSGIPIEIDLKSNQADNASNPATYGGLGIRKGVNMAIVRGTTSDTTINEYSSGFWVSLASGENVCGAGTQPCDYIDSGYSVATNIPMYSVFDARGAQVVTGSTAPVIALNMTDTEVVDFASNLTSASLKAAPQRYMQYNATAACLDYDNAVASVLWSACDNGTMTIGADTINTGGNFTTSGAFPLTLTSTGTTNVTLPTSGMLLNSSTGATSGANSNITSLSGLTTALSIAQGGTGAATSSAALTRLGAQPAIAGASGSLLGGPTSSGGAPAAVTASTGLTLSGGTLTVTNPANPVNVQTFTASGTWTAPSYCTSGTPCQVSVVAIGSGGSGGGGGMETSGTAISGGASGGDGACLQATYVSTALPSSVTVTIGSAATGGMGATANGSGSNGAAGGNTSFGNLIAGGGGAGGGGTTSGSGGGGAGGIGVVGGNGSGSSAGSANASNGNQPGGASTAATLIPYGTQNAAGSGSSTSSAASGPSAPCVGGPGAGGPITTSAAAAGGFGGSAIGSHIGMSGGAAKGAAGSASSVATGTWSYQTTAPSGGGGNFSGTGGAGGGCGTGYGVGGAGAGAGTTAGGAGGASCPGYVQVTTWGI
jgi:hypothetical protein